MRLSAAELVRAALEASDVTLRVEGSSMVGLLRADDRIVVERCHPLDLLPGEIALVGDSSLAVHRFLFRSGDRFIFKGDATRDLDPPRCAEEILGRVVARVRDGRRRSLPRRPVRATLARLRFALGRALGRGPRG